MDERSDANAERPPEGGVAHEDGVGTPQEGGPGAPQGPGPAQEDGPAAWDPAGVELKPKKSTFIISRVVPSFIGLALVGGWATLIYAAQPPAAAAALAAVLAACALLAALAAHAARVAYRKERYVLHATQIVSSRGGLLSDEHTELDVRHITHVKLRLPWLRYKLFGVGDVSIESAGSSESAIAFRTIRAPEQAYAQVQDLMRRNGFSLRKRELLHEEQPDPLGVALECVGIAIAAAVALAWALGHLLLGFSREEATRAAWFLAALGPAVALAALTALTIHFLDLRRRTYRVFDDAIVYEEGFLTRDNAFMPAENLADSNTRRALLDQLLGLYDVAVSCQGSGQEIKFRRLRRGVELTEAIDRVVAAHRSLAASERARGRPAEASPPPTDQGDGHGDGAGAGDGGEPLPGAGGPRPRPEASAAPAWTAELQMHAGRAVLPLVALCVLLPPLVPLWLIGIVWILIQAWATTFEVRAGSVRSSYRFLTAREREFSFDKVTGVVVRESVLDRWLRTVTVRFWSIGAAEPLDLLHVRRDELDLPALLRQAGIPADQELTSATSRFSIGAGCKAAAPSVVVGALTLAGLVVTALLLEPLLLLLLAPVPLAVLAWVLYLGAFYRRARLLLHPQHAELREGVLIRRVFRARYDAVKKLVITRYPRSELGSVHFAVAGEHRVGGGQQGQASGGAQGAGMVVPYGFSLHYTGGLDAKAVVLDEVLEAGAGPEQVAALEGRAPVRAPEPLRSSRPALANSMTALLLVSVLLLPLAALLPLTIPWTVLVVRRRRYVVEPRRVVARSGVIYRVQASILHGRIDTLRRNQGILNKAFGNGDVTLFTAGSSQPDLVLAHLPDYEAVHEVIKRHYGRPRE